MRSVPAFEPDRRGGSVGGICARTFRRRRISRRRGVSLPGLLLGVAVLVGIVGGGWWYVQRQARPTNNDDLLTHPVRRGEFVLDVTERGELESSSNVEVRCEVLSRNSSGVVIIEIVPEGSSVQEGDFLVKLDDSALQSDRTTQQIAVNSSAALAEQAKNELESAQIARKEYEEGTYKQEAEKLQSELFVAEENFRRAEEYLRYSQKLAARGYVTEIQLEADQFAVEKAKKELDLAKTKLEVLDTYTKTKTLKKHDADIKTAEAKLASEEAKNQLERDKLALIESQIAKCVIVAPKGGQVVYDHEMESWRGSDDRAIKMGAIVNERQVLIRLPDPQKMQVKAKISESRIDLVKTGMATTILLDALPGTELKGTVTKVNEYPAPGNWFNSAVKEYMTFIEIDSPPAGLRPGMTAQVAIRVETTPDVLQVPVQAVLERGGKHWCLLPATGDELESREILIGASNEKFLVVRDGLAADEMVLLNPRMYASRADLPAADAPAPPAPKESKAEAATATASVGSFQIPARRGRQSAVGSTDETSASTATPETATTETATATTAAAGEAPQGETTVATPATKPVRVATAPSS